MSDIIAEDLWLDQVSLFIINSAGSPVAKRPLYAMMQPALKEAQTTKGQVVIY